MGVPTPRNPLEFIAYSIGKVRKQRKKLKVKKYNRYDIRERLSKKNKADPTKVKAGASNPPKQTDTPKYQPHAGGSRRVSQQHSKTFHMVNGKPRLFTSGGKDFKGENK